MASHPLRLRRLRVLEGVTGTVRPGSNRTARSEFSAARTRTLPESAASISKRTLGKLAALGIAVVVARTQPGGSTAVPVAVRTTVGRCRGTRHSSVTAAYSVLNDIGIYPDDDCALRSLVYTVPSLYPDR